MSKTIEQINEKIQNGSVVVLTAEEIINVVRKKGVQQTAREVDVVTTGTFSPMCSSGAFLNIKQLDEKMKFGGGHVHLNEVPAYAGLAAADIYIGATALPENHSNGNNGKPAKFPYGGAHVIEELISGEKVTLRATAHGTDCYPLKKREQIIGLNDMHDAFLFNPRNGYQNYNVAVNLSDNPLYTYLGKLKPRLGNANYSNVGQLSPLFNDPHYRTIGIGTRVFFCGAQGYVAWNGTQHNPSVPRRENGTPRIPAGNLALVGNLKEMGTKWIKAISIKGYGVTLSIGLGVPIPILDEEMVRFVSVTDADIKAPLVEFSQFYPYGKGKNDLGEVTYAELKSGYINVKGKIVPTASLTSYTKAREIAIHLKNLIGRGEFLLTQPQALLPGARQ